MHTPTLTPHAMSREWRLIDATDAVVGRLASQVASILRGKHKSTFTPHMDAGDFVIIINASKAEFTGKKETDKLYWRHTGFPGGEKSVTPAYQRTQRPERILYYAVKGMLPKGPLGRKVLKKLKVYEGAQHPHQAQAPKPLSLNT